MNLQQSISNLRESILDKLWYPVKRFYRSVRNVIRWFPVIWKDRDWDDWYILEILKFKIKNQAEYIGGRDFHTRAKRDAEIMMVCVRLLERIQEEYYDMELYNYYRTDLIFVPSETRPGSYSIEEDLISENLDDYFKKYPRTYKQIVNEFKGKEKKIIAIKMGIHNHYKAKKLLFKILEEQMERWWD